MTTLNTKLIAFLSLATGLWACITPAQAETLLVKSQATKIAAVDNAKLSILDILTFQMDKFLVANGDTTPLPDAYHPEHGEPGYFDTYYGAVDPSGQRKTLNDWLAVNDFNTYPTLVDKAEYINAADLGFGRIMRCIDNGKSSCYVKNYLDPKGASTFAATVAMERMPNSYGTFVAFFVYDNTGKRINQIPLDSEGNKSVPQSCWACHGGYGHGSGYYGGNFLPFDVANLEDWPGHPTRAAQSEALRRLNLLVWSDAEYLANNDNLKTLIEKWYGGVPFSGTSYAKASAPSSWLTQPSGGSSTDPTVYAQNKVEQFLYKDIYGEYCRMCHVTQDLDWQTAKAGDFAVAAYNQLCVSGNNKPTMPHAEVTYNDFFNTKPYSALNLNPPGTSLSISKLNTSVINNVSIAKSSLAINPELLASISGSLATDVLQPVKYSAHQMLCQQLPLSFPAGNKTQGNAVFSSKGCAGCHYIGTYQAGKPGGDLECKGAWLRQNMGTVNSAMSGIALSIQNIQDIALHLNDRPNCN